MSELLLTGCKAVLSHQLKTFLACLGTTCSNMRFYDQSLNGHHVFRDQARGRLGRNGRPWGRNFALNGTQGEVGVSLKKKKKNFFFFFFFRETHFHSVTTQMQAVVTLSDNLLPLHRVSPSIKWQ